MAATANKESVATVHIICNHSSYSLSLQKRKPLCTYMKKCHFKALNEAVYCVWSLKWYNRAHKNIQLYVRHVFHFKLLNWANLNECVWESFMLSHKISRLVLMSELVSELFWERDCLIMSFLELINKDFKTTIIKSSKLLNELKI